MPSSAHSVSSVDHDSDDSLDGQPSIHSFHGLIVSPSSADQPSITTGVGRKSSLEIDHHYHPHHHQPSQAAHHQHTSQFDKRRDSDKSLAFSDDSLSNDSAQLSPSQDGGVSAASSSGFKSGGESHSDATCCDPADVSARLSPDSLSGSTVASAIAVNTSPAAAAAADECYEFPLPYECYNLDATRILEMVKQTIDSKMPPMGFVLHHQRRHDNEGRSLESPTAAANGSAGIHNLSLEYSGGLQIELQVCDGRRSAAVAASDNGVVTDGSEGATSPAGNMGLKMRRISGDQFEYGKLCQQLISSLTV